MELRVLQYFLAVAREQNISAAAQSLHLTQPTLSRQSDNKGGLYRWLRKEPTELHTVATYNLIYNASLMVDEGMGYVFTLDKLINTTGSNLCFRPLKPKLELGMYLVWKKSQIFSRAMELFLEQLRENLTALCQEET